MYSLVKGMPTTGSVLVFRRSDAALSRVL